jgi:drug/metabolite transporter (DMT)-like permease
MVAKLLMFAACGAAGALIYSFPVYLKAVSRKPPTQFALVNFVFSITVGAVLAMLLTRQIGFHFPWTVEPEPWPLALVVGVGSNPLVPIFVRKMEKWAEAFEGKSR